MSRFGGVQVRSTLHTPKSGSLPADFQRTGFVYDTELLRPKFKPLLYKKGVGVTVKKVLDSNANNTNKRMPRKGFNRKLA